jgi:hypothetical protein
MANATVNGKVILLSSRKMDALFMDLIIENKQKMDIHSHPQILDSGKVNQLLMCRAESGILCQIYKFPAKNGHKDGGHYGKPWLRIEYKELQAASPLRKSVLKSRF